MSATQTQQTLSARLADQLLRAAEGDAWHGPALREVLEDISAQQAVARPIAGAHSIREILAHLSAWAVIVRRRLAGEAITDVGPAEDWPALEIQDGDAWADAQRRAVESVRRLARAVGELPDEKLGDRVPGQDYSNDTMLLGALQHTLYHTGQIAILKKAGA